MLVATHDGSFHADEVFAVAALTLVEPGLEVVRTRAREELARADLRVDVGFAFDPAAGHYDHHQREFSEARDNGVAYASFGLIWRAYGARVCGGDEELAAAVDTTLVQGVDANDVGQSLTTAVIDGAFPLTVNGVIGAFNAPWDGQQDDGAGRGRFDAAVELARGIIEREVASAAAGLRSKRIVRGAIEKAEDPRIVVLPVNAPWKSVLVPEAPDALYVIYPKKQGFGLEAVPRELGSFANRKDLPEDWAGRENEDLERITGVPGVLFCHVKRFLAVARTREAIDALARLALEA